MARLSPRLDLLNVLVLLNRGSLGVQNLFSMVARAEVDIVRWIAPVYCLRAELIQSETPFHCSRTYKEDKDDEDTIENGTDPVGPIPPQILTSSQLWYNPLDAAYLNDISAYARASTNPDTQA